MSGAFTGEGLRRVMRYVPSPVTVITFFSNDEPRGMTIGSFTSVSVDPPLILFNVDRQSGSHDAISEAPRFTVNILAEDQAAIGQHFATSGLESEEQFAPIELMDAERLIIDGTVASLHCETTARHRAGDSTIIVARVLEGSGYDGRRPLLYHNRTYRSLGESMEVSLFAPVNRASKETP